MGHYASEMTSDGELTEAQQAQLDLMRLEAERRRVVHAARVAGMAVAIEHLVRHSPLPIDVDFITRHLGLDGREPEVGAVYEALREAWAPGATLRIGANHVVEVAR